MKATERTLTQTLHSGDQYLIPVFQRYYTWEKRNWEQLWDDLSGIFEHEGEPTRHFMGSIVCVPEDHVPGVVPGYQVIDGQQRLTTLSLLLAAIRDSARAQGWDQLGAEVDENYLVHRFKQGQERYKLYPRLRDREAYLAIIDQTGATVPGAADSRILQSHRYHLAQLKEHGLLDKEDKLRAFFTVVTTRIDFVSITLGKESPYKIFKSLNSTGVDLEQGDLIRNHVFMAMPVKEQDTFDDEHWRPLERHFDDQGKLDDVAFAAFFRDTLMSSGSYVGPGEIHERFEQLYPRSKLQPAEVSTFLGKKAKHYDWLRGLSPHPDADVNAGLQSIRGLNASTAYPTVLALFDAQERAKLTLPELREALSAISSFILRRYVCGLGSRGYGRWFCAACREMGEHPFANLIKFLKSKGWPDDATFMAKFERMNLYSSQYDWEVLRSIEQASQASSEPVSLEKCWIEHVMPQTIVESEDDGAKWVSALGGDWRRIKGEWENTPGNLTLVGYDYNIEMKNKPFEEKRPILVGSKVYLNSHFADSNLKVWNEDAIKQRGRALAKLAAKVWPGPDVSAHLFGASDA